MAYCEGDESSVVLSEVEVGRLLLMVFVIIEDICYYGMYLLLLW